MPRHETEETSLVCGDCRGAMVKCVKCPTPNGISYLCPRCDAAEHDARHVRADAELERRRRLVERANALLGQAARRRGLVPIVGTGGAKAVLH